MEAKLMQAAAKLPTPALEFDCIRRAAVCRIGATKRRHTVQRVLLAAVLVLSLAMTVFAYGKTHYGLWSGYSSNSFADVEILARRYDYDFPKQLGGYSFSCMSTTFGAPQGVSHLKAIMTPTYKLHSVNYGGITISFGTTELDTWKYHFSVAEDGSCSDENVKAESQSTVPYKEYILHLYAIDNRYSIRWEDEARLLVVDVTCLNTDNFDAALEAAKLLIDRNR